MAGGISDRLGHHLYRRCSHLLKRRIHLLPLRKDNQKAQWTDQIRRILGRVRHQVETVFSTLTTVFNVQRPRGRTLGGHVVRLATCVLAHTLSFLMV